MRTVRSGRNRTSLVCGGLLMMVVSAWVLSAVTPLAQIWPQGAHLLPRADATVSDLVIPAQEWLLPAAAVGAVLAALIGFLLLAQQIPPATAQTTLRITGHDDGLLGSLRPAVLERALIDAVEGMAGVRDARVRVWGSAGAPQVHATVTIADSAETAWVAEAVRRRLHDDLTAVFDVAPARLDLLIQLRTGKARQTVPLESSPAGAKSAKAGSATAEVPTAEVPTAEVRPASAVRPGPAVPKG